MVILEWHKQNKKLSNRKLKIKKNYDKKMWIKYQINLNNIQQK